jgi:lysophospholipase L1-like esterase
MKLKQIKKVIWQASSWTVAGFILVSLPIHSIAQTRVSCVGTSITAGNGMGQPYPNFLPRLLGSGYTVHNDGQSGSGPAGYLTGNVIGNVFSFKPNMIIIEFGANDIKTGIWNKAAFVASYNQVIDDFLTITPKPQIWLMLPPPILPTNPYGMMADTMTKSVIPFIRSTAAQRGMNLIDVFDEMLEHTELLPDGCHPTSAGADTIAHIVYRHLLGKPIAALSDTLVPISYTIGGSKSTQSRQIAVVNTLPQPHISGAAIITKKHQWLTVSVDATKPDSQVLTNSVDPSSFTDSEQKLYDTVTVHFADSAIPDVTYRVLVWIRQSASISSVIITPDSALVPSNKPVRFTAVAYDQYGVPLANQPALTWSAIGGSISSTGLFTPAIASGDAKITASSIGNAVTGETHATIVTCQSGINFDFYAHAGITTVKDIASLTPTKSGTAAKISFQPVTTTDSFALRFNGYILAPVSGNYAFTIHTDGGAVLSIDNAVIADNDGNHNWTAQTGYATLKAGLHSIEALYHNQLGNGGNKLLDIEWQGPGWLINFIPDSAFFRGTTGTIVSHEQIAHANNPEMITSLSTLRNGFAVTVPNGRNWVLGLYTLDGTRIAEYSGKGIGFVSHENKIAQNGFVVARLRAGSAAVVSKNLFVQSGSLHQR